MITTVTQTHALTAGTPQGYGSITPQFNNLDVFVDFGAAGLGDLNVVVTAQAGVGGPTVVVANQNVRRTAVTDPQQMIAVKGLGAKPDGSIATTGIVGSTIYTLTITSDNAIAALKATMAGYDSQVNNQPDETVVATHPVVMGTEVSFGILNNYHIYVQADVDFGANNTNNGCTFRLYGTAGVGSGGVRTKLFEKFLTANPNSTGRVQQIISLPNDFQAVGCDTFELVAVAANPITGADSSLTCSLVGFDPNLIVGPGPLPPGVGAIGLDVIWRPGGVAGGNVFITWPTALAAAQNAGAGPVTIGIDPSISAAIIPSAGMPVGGWDLQSRIFLVGVGPALAYIPVSIPDGSTLLNSPGGSNLHISAHPLAAGSNLPAFSYTLGILAYWQLLNFTGTAGSTRPLVDIQSGIIIEFFAINFSLLGNNAAGAEQFKLIDAGSTLILIFESNTTFEGTAIVSGPGTFSFQRDSSCSPIVTSAAFTGATPTYTVNESLHSENIVTIAAVTLVIDATAIPGGRPYNETICCKPTGVGTTIINLPDGRLPMNAGRRLFIVDANGTSNANTISLVPFGAQNLNGANALKALSSSWGTWIVTCEGGGTAGAQWIVSQSAGI